MLWLIALAIAFIFVAVVGGCAFLIWHLEETTLV